jgi:dephospho-CoA kinase
MIIGVTGTIGAGKGTVVDYLVKEKNFTHYSVRDFLMDEIAERGLHPDRDAMRDVANDLREKYGPACIIENLYQQAEGAQKNNEMKDIAPHNALIESVRTIGEAEFLKDRGVVLLAVDADQRLRFERITERGATTDHIDFDTFVIHEKRELESTEPYDMNVSAVMNMSDMHIINEESLEELHAQVDKMLEGLK